jgi:catechol 2,3-dioxygenase-like lactoylglutathione lyase family enzyme
VIVGLDHVQLAMPAGGEDAARSFYGGILGLTECEKPQTLRGRGGCWFEAPGVKLHLGIEDPFHPAARAHPALLVDNLEALREVLDCHGVLFSPGTPLEGYARGDVRDPFGNRAELMQKL